MTRPLRFRPDSHFRMLAAIAAIGIGFACHAPTSPPSRDVAVTVSHIAVDRSGVPVVILEEQGGDRALPIWIGVAEARSIASEIERLHPRRPNTHDLTKRLIEGIDGVIERVVVTELRDDTYYALVQVSARGQRLEVDARPSDAIALALRFEAPLLVREALFDAANSAQREPAEERAL